MRSGTILRVTVTIYDILDQLRSSSLSKAEQGTRFERLTKAFLTTDPLFADQFSKVWSWSEWPGNGGKHDTGIDLVAEDRVTGGLVAIQCKFYAPTSTISKDDIDTFLSESGKEGFIERVVVSTTDKWNAHAENAIKSQQVPVRRIGVSDLEASPIDWSQFSIETPEVLVTTGRNKLRAHQVDAIEAVTTGFAAHDRGKLIMACGTGKTYTSLALAQQLVGAGGSVLFLVPSISLLSQTLREWSNQSEIPLRPLAVCSDRKSTRRSANDNEDIATVDLALPATTNVPVLVDRLHLAEADTEAMTVVFSTYQSIDVVARAQAGAGIKPFDLIICDEAHRTTGVTLVDDDNESPFVRIHDNTYIQGSKRLYMTATPKIYDDATKAKAGEAAAVLASMDDEARFGPEFYRLGFGEAVENKLLTDYKVLVLAVDGKTVATTFQTQLADAEGELQLDDVAKIIGCWNGLAKRGNAEQDFSTDPEPMRRAVAFAGKIQDSKKIEAMFSNLVEQYVATHETDDHEPEHLLDCQVKHVDGTFNALERNTKLDWLRADIPEGQCRILTNARCLSEGVDVPALDAVMFMAPRKSKVDIVQSVGRVMRLAPGKKYGYIILPIAIPDGITPEVALADNTRFQVVWDVLQALRAHDDRFNAEINKIDLTKRRSDRIDVIGVGYSSKSDNGSGTQLSLGLSFDHLDQWRDAIYTKIVKKVGSRRYWETWAKDIAAIAENHITRITALLDGNHPQVSAAFDRFLDGLRGNLNDGITRADAIEMLAQHLITRPVFDALFTSYDFAAHNPVAQTMEQMLTVLDEQSIDNENASLEKFYNSVRMRAQGIDTAEGRQKIIVELYENFFATAFKRTVDKLGIVYTPVEVVDFILRSADEVLRAEFGQGMTDENVHILDGFTGTGTFIVRLIQSGLINAADLPRKYSNELHANEILLLAYYIAAINIEAAYHDAIAKTSEAHDYEPFPGLILTDTFQSWEDDDRLDYEVFRENNARLERLKELPITVIVGNPPYRSGQDDANDNVVNESYPDLDEAIRVAYAENSSAKLKNSLYDSYVRAIRWASLRIKDRGVIAFVTNGGWIESNAFDAMRKSLVEEFSSIYAFNLKGNQKKTDWKREGGKIFGGGSQATVAITIFVRNGTKTQAASVYYAEIGDYLSREQKLSKIHELGGIASVEFKQIQPNNHGEWVNQRNEEFTSYHPIDGSTGAIFASGGPGIKSNRDSWVFNFGTNALSSAMTKAVESYEAALSGNRTDDSSRIKWSSGLEGRLARKVHLSMHPELIQTAMYRPFQRVRFYGDRNWIDRPGVIEQMFPEQLSNTCIAVPLPGSMAPPFLALAVDQVVDAGLAGLGAIRVFPRWRYEPATPDSAHLFETDGEIIGTFRKVDNVTDEALAKFRTAYGTQITKDDIFFYVYGLLHSHEYREVYEADLKKMLPRIPLVVDPWPFIEAGRELSDLHINYENVEPYQLDGFDVDAVGDPYKFFRVEKMAYGKQRVDGKTATDKSTITYNSRITLTGVPKDSTRFMLGSRSAVEWIIERYQVKRDKASGIVNDPNDWSREVGNPRYILDLLARVVTVSVNTMKFVDALPPLRIHAEQ
ncbi:DEAD/DEAH box helicase [Nocardia gipuzkoensis]